MSRFNPALIRPTSGKGLAKRRDLNRVIGDVATSGEPPSTGHVSTEHLAEQGDFSFLGVIAEKGPNGEADYTKAGDLRYWVAPVFISPGPAEGVAFGASGHTVKPYPVTAHNLGEFGVGGHALPTGFPVLVRLSWTNEADAKRVWLFWQTPPSVAMNPFLVNDYGGGGWYKGIAGKFYDDSTNQPSPNANTLDLMAISDFNISHHGVHEAWLFNEAENGRDDAPHFIGAGIVVISHRAGGLMDTAATPIFGTNYSQSMRRLRYNPTNKCAEYTTRLAKDSDYVASDWKCAWQFGTCQTAPVGGSEAF